MSNIRQSANIITACRIAGAVALIFIMPFTPAFYFVYLMCGVTDILDGFIARKFHIDGKFGERFDSIADLCFVIASAVKLIPHMELPVWIWCWTCLIAVIRIVNLVCAVIYLRKFCSLHTTANKISGFLLFLLPLTICFVDLRVSSAVVCAVATFASLQEGHFIRTNKVG